MPESSSRRPPVRIGSSWGSWWMLFTGWSGERCTVFDAGDELIVQRSDVGEILRRRVVLDEVLLMTRRLVRRTTSALVFIGLVGLMWSIFILVGFTARQGWAMAIGLWAGFLIIWLPLLIIGLSRLPKVVELTVQTRRACATLRFPYRRREAADRLAQNLAQRIRNRHEERRAALLAASLPQVAEAVPPSAGAGAGA